MTLYQNTDRALGISYGIGPLIALTNLMNIFVTKMMVNRRGGRGRDDANNAPANYFIMRVAGMSHTVWWLSKVVMLGSIVLVYAGTAALTAQLGGVFDSTALYGSNSFGGALGFFFVVAAATWAAIPLYCMFVAIPWFNDPYNSAASLMRNFILAILVLGFGNVFYFTVFASGGVIGGIIVAIVSLPAGLLQGVALSVSTGPLAQSASLSLPALSLIMFLVATPINIALAAGMDGAVEGNPPLWCCCCRPPKVKRREEEGKQDWVIVHRVYKTYRKMCGCCRADRGIKKAVVNVSLSFPPNAVSCLLGHNGVYVCADIGHTCSRCHTLMCFAAGAA